LSFGSNLADDNSEANELFVEAVKLVKSAEYVEGLEEKVVVGGIRGIRYVKINPNQAPRRGGRASYIGVSLGLTG